MIVGADETRADTRGGRAQFVSVHPCGGGTGYRRMSSHPLLDPQLYLSRRMTTRGTYR